MDRIRPRCKADRDLSAPRWLHLDPRHRIADEQTVKHHADDLRLLRRRNGRHSAPLHALRRDCSNRTLHARAYNGGNLSLTYDNSRSLLHAGGLCGICVGKTPESCKNK